MLPYGETINANIIHERERDFQHYLPRAGRGRELKGGQISVIIYNECPGRRRIGSDAILSARRALSRAGAGGRKRGMKHFAKIGGFDV
jgi:hypothetical protein